MPFSDPEKYGKHRFSPRIIIYPLVLLAAVWFMNKQQKIIEATKRQNENTQPPLQRMAVVPTTDSGELKPAGLGNPAAILRLGSYEIGRLTGSFGIAEINAFLDEKLKKDE